MCVFLASVPLFSTKQLAIASLIERDRDPHGDTEAVRYKTRRKENKSKYELLENKINSNIDDFGSKLDHICKACTKQKCIEKSGHKHFDKEPTQRCSDHLHF